MEKVEKNHYNEDLFRSKEIWKDYDPTGLIDQKTSVVLSKIPNDVKTILDIGCGNGIITNKLAENYEVTGLDNSQEALDFLSCNKIHASADRIPVHADSFDMVFSSELIEHLPNGVLEKSCEEMMRVSRKYIFITVPNNEYLDRSNILCSSCNEEFHIYGHLQSFDLSKLMSLFKGMSLIWTDQLGKRVSTYNAVLLKLKQNLLGQYFTPNDHTVCPNCGNRSFEQPVSNLATKAINGINKVATSFVNRKYWLAALFEKP